MKNAVFLFLLIGMYVGTQNVCAQEKPQKIAKEMAEEEKGPALFDYEPDFLAAREARRAKIDSIVSIIDTLDISENRRLKLIRDIYRNKESRRLNKILLADNKYEDDIE